MCSPFSSIEDDFDTSDELNVSDKPKKLIAYNDLSRREVRSLIFHILYAAEAFDYEESLPAIIDNFNHGFDLAIPLDGELISTATAIVTSRNQLEKSYESLLANWRIERVSVCTKLILWFGIWELQNTQTDPRIVINEAIELSKCFAEEGSHRFINGILDAIAKEKA